MLYPDFDELVALKEKKAYITPSSDRLIKSTIPGDHHSPFRGQGLEFDAVREYIPGDDIRNIDWRVTARTGSPHLKLFKEERERSIILCIDMNETMRFGTRNTFKSVQAARVASLLAWQGLAAHNRVGACLFGDVPDGMQFLAPKRTRKSLWGMIKLLTQPPRESHHISMNDALQHIKKAAPTGSLIYVISDFIDLTNHLTRSLSRLNKRCDVVFISVNDPMDRSMFPLGSITLQGKNREKFLVNTESISGRKTYEAQWEDNRRKLSEICSRLKIAMVEITTEGDAHRDLILGLKKLGRRRIK